eukprot:GCRY01002393.1.p1 GENE.GCRY01002393.1~~GCRY01002393.1.p1  ORF type:complete len:143 (+),score=5.20 GCRY01002393.1:188-616(+)
MSNDPVLTAVATSSFGGSEFVDIFFKTYDTKRSETIKFFRETSFLVWNGNKASGLSEIATALDKIPPTQHTIETLDCQPIPESLSANSFGILVSVNGKISMTSKKSHPFTESIVLLCDPNKPGQKHFFVASDVFRCPDLNLS